MIIPMNGADKALGVHLNKIYKTHNTTAVEQASRRDVVTISKFSALVERARACAMAQPDIRPEAVERAKATLEDGNLATGGDIASSLINRAVEGLV
ncbi:MAG: flagellar biosynthesis anti-sigma factor FlgM [Armatimonadota bacterium]